MGRGCPDFLMSQPFPLGSAVIYGRVNILRRQEGMPFHLREWSRCETLHYL